jgi:hypothetical protein
VFPFLSSRGVTRLFVARAPIVSEINARTRTESACEANGFVSDSPGGGADRWERPGGGDISDLDRRIRTAATPVEALLPGRPFGKDAAPAQARDVRGVNAAF